MPIEIRGQHLRIRQLDPKLFIEGSFRTHDVGKPGGTKRIVGRLKKTGKWATQSYIFEVDALKEGRISTWYTLFKVKDKLSPRRWKELDNLQKKEFGSVRMKLPKSTRYV